MVEVKPFENFPFAVYVDGVLIPKQLLQDPIIHNGFVEVTCFSNTNSAHGRNIDSSFYKEYQVKSCLVEPKTKHSHERTTFYLRLG